MCVSVSEHCFLELRLRVIDMCPRSRGIDPARPEQLEKFIYLLWLCVALGLWNDIPSRGQQKEMT